MSGPIEDQGLLRPESYVVAVSDATLIQQARDYLSAGGGVPYLVPRVSIASGSNATNLNYAEPGHPTWPWHATSLIEWTVFDPSVPRTAEYVLNIDGRPSAVPQMLAGDATDPAVTTMSLIHYPVVMELVPGTNTAVANVSTRGWVGTGERVLIAGFIVQGAEPRNVVVRGIGPSLTGFGIGEPLVDPKIEIYHGQAKIAENNDWQKGSFVRVGGIPENPQPWYSWLFPSDPKEAAFQLSLPPGAYTVHVSGVDNATGIALAEVYDLDALKPQ